MRVVGVCVPSVNFVNWWWVWVWVRAGRCVCVDVGVFESVYHLHDQDCVW